LAFYPFEIHEVITHGLRKTSQFVSFLHFGKLALQSQIVRNKNLVLFLNNFDGIIPPVGTWYCLQYSQNACYL
jgi:hypothetical protein